MAAGTKTGPTRSRFWRRETVAACRRFVFATIGVSIVASAALCRFADHVYVSVDRHIGYLTGLFSTALPAIARLVLLSWVGRARSGAGPSNVQRVVRWFLGLGVAFFVGMLIFSLM